MNLPIRRAPLPGALVQKHARRTQTSTCSGLNQEGMKKTIMVHSLFKLINKLSPMTSGTLIWHFEIEKQIAPCADLFIISKFTS